jgi:hypothetical protein
MRPRGDAPVHAPLEHREGLAGRQRLERRLSIMLEFDLRPQPAPRTAHTVDADVKVAQPFVGAERETGVQSRQPAGDTGLGGLDAKAERTGLQSQAVAQTQAQFLCARRKRHQHRWIKPSSRSACSAGVRSAASQGLSAASSPTDNG